MKYAAHIRMSVFTGLLAFSFGACGGEKKDDSNAKPQPKEATNTETKAEPTAPKVDLAAAAAEAKTVFEARCVACHGSTGLGDGPGAAAINPKPRNYTDPAWQSSVSDEDIAAAIVKGGLAVGKSAVMPSNPDLKGKPEVVNALVNIIRDFEK